MRFTLDGIDALVSADESTLWRVSADKERAALEGTGGFGAGDDGGAGAGIARSSQQRVLITWRRSELLALHCLDDARLWSSDQALCLDSAP
jgi:hypothetical protein